MMNVWRKVAPLAVLLYLVRSADGMARRTTYFEDADCVRGVVQEYVYGATAIAPDGSTSPAPFNMCYTRGSTGAITTCDPQDGTTAVDVYLDQECTNHVYTTSDGPRCVEITQEDPSSGPVSSSVECVDASPSAEIMPEAFNLVGSPYADSHCTTRTGGEQVVRGSAFGVGAQACTRSALSRGRLPQNSECMADGSVFSQMYAYSDASCAGDMLMEGVVFYGPKDPNATGDELPGLCVGGEFEEGVVYYRLTSCTLDEETGPQPTPQYPTPAPAPAHVITPMPIVDNDDDDLSYSYGPEPSPDDDEDDWDSERGGGDDGDDDGDGDGGDEDDDGEDEEDDDGSGDEDDDGSGDEDDDGSGKEDDDGSGKEDDDGSGKEDDDGSGDEDDDGSGGEMDDDGGHGDDPDDDGSGGEMDDDGGHGDDPEDDDEPCHSDEHSDDDAPCGDHGSDDDGGDEDDTDGEEGGRPCGDGEGDDGCEDEPEDDDEEDDDEEGGEQGENVDAFDTDGGEGEGDRSGGRLSGDAIFAIVFGITMALLICVFSALLAVMSREPTPQVGPKS